MAKIDISVLLRAKDEASNVLTRLGNKLGKTGRDFDKFKKNALIASAGIAAVGAGALKLATDAGKFESVRDSFEGMTKGMIDSTDSFIDQVQRASAGTLSSMDVVGGATKAISLIGKESFSDFGTDFAKMAELSKKAARATGQDVNFMFESLIRGTARSSKLILDNLGITLDMADAQSKYADELKKSNGLTDIHAQKASLLKTVIEELDKTYADVSVTSGGLSGAQQKLKATLSDLSVTIGTQLMPIFNDFIRDVALPFATNYGPKFADVLGKLVGGFRDLATPLKALIAGLVALLPTLVAVGLIVKPLVAGFSAMGFIIKTPLTSAIVLLIGWFLLLRKEFQLAGEGLATWGSKIEEFGGRFGESIELWKKMFSDYADSLSEKNLLIQEALGNLRAAFGMTSEQWADALGQMMADMDNWIVNILVRFQNWKDSSSYHMQENEKNMIVSMGNWMIKTKENLDNWAVDTDKRITQWVNKTQHDFLVWAENVWRGAFLNLQTNLSTFFEQKMEQWRQAIPIIWNEIAIRWTGSIERIIGAYQTLFGWIERVVGKIGDFISRIAEARKMGINLPEFQTGGIVPGPIGQPALATVHGGEEVIPAGGQRRGGGGGVVFNVHIGLYAGTEVEKRNIARELYGALMRVAQARNTTVEDMVLSGS